MLTHDEVMNLQAGDEIYLPKVDAVIYLTYLGSNFVRFHRRYSPDRQEELPWCRIKQGTLNIHNRFCFTCNEELTREQYKVELIQVHGEFERHYFCKDGPCHHKAQEIARGIVHG